MVEAGIEHRKMEQSFIEHQLPVDAMNMNVFEEMGQSQTTAATASEEVAALRSRIAKHESACSSVCESLLAETTRQSDD